MLAWRKAVEGGQDVWSERGDARRTFWFDVGASSERLFGFILVGPLVIRLSGIPVPWIPFSPKVIAVAGPISATSSSAQEEYRLTATVPAMSIPSIDATYKGSGCSKSMAPKHAGPGGRCISAWILAASRSPLRRSQPRRSTTAPRSASCSIRPQARWPRSPAIVGMTRTAFAPQSPSIIPRRSSCRRAQPLRQARPPRLRLRSVIATFKSPPNTVGAAWQKASEYTTRACVEATTGRFK